MIYFTQGGTTVPLKDPTWPEGPEVLPRQVIGISGGGAIKVATLGDPDTIITLNFRQVESSQWAAVATFIQSTIEFSAYTFSYQDWNGVTLTNMRYVSGIETWKRRRGNRYEGSLTLREDLGV